MNTKPISRVVAKIRSDIEKTHRTALFTIVSIKSLSALIDYISEHEQLHCQWPEQLEPFMYAIREPDGSAYMDEYCVDLNREHIEGVAASLNETIPTEAPNKYSVVALYTAPSAVSDEVTPDYWVYDTKFGLDISREKPADAENTEPYFPVFKKMLAAVSSHQPENTEKSPDSITDKAQTEPDYTRYDCGSCGYESLYAITRCPRCNHEPIGVTPLYIDPPAPDLPVVPDVIPEGWTLVPKEIHLDASDIEGICSQCGDGGHMFGDFTDGVLWVGATIDTSPVHGLHISSADYPEEGCITLAEFAAPQPEHIPGTRRDRFFLRGE